MNSPCFLLYIGNLTNDSLIIVLVGYVVVFISLAILYFVFDNIPLLLNIRLFRSTKKDSTIKSDHEEVVVENSITGEETAAISAAVFLFVEELHDEENAVLTIEKISKRYSPWSSKIYGITNGLNKRF